MTKNISAPKRILLSWQIIENLGVQYNDNMTGQGDIVLDNCTCMLNIIYILMFVYGKVIEQAGAELGQD